ncbi:MAG: ParB/RepB/Spo0J family partition protein [Deltaproteobacteria bacterium]|nr:ParB/RepB/Spo0J family partition protein [Deltaproteobacteria bacterium]
MSAEPIPENGPSAEKEQNASPTGDRGEYVARMPLHRIHPNPNQPRRHFNPEQIRELSRSIQSQGVIQPLVVRPHPERKGEYELVAGERRLKAITLLAWENAPVVVRQIPDANLLEAALVENLQREQLTPLEEALAYRTLLDQYGYTQEALSRRVGKDRSTIANMIRLLSLPQSIQQDLDHGRLSVGHARALLAVTDPVKQLALRKSVLTRDLSVREVEQLVNRERETAARKTGGDKGEAAAPHRDNGRLREELHFTAAAETLERSLGTRIGIRRQGRDTPEGGGCIEIEYYSLEDFNRLFEILMARAPHTEPE